MLSSYEELPQLHAMARRYGGHADVTVRNDLLARVAQVTVHWNDRVKTFTVSESRFVSSFESEVKNRIYQILLDLIPRETQEEVEYADCFLHAFGGVG